MNPADENDNARIRDIWHVGITVSNLERAIAFYTSGLGLEVRHRQVQRNSYTSRLVGYDDAHLEMAQLRFPGAERSRSGHVIELIEYIEPRGQPGVWETRHPGTAHLALEVGDIHATARRLAQLGATFVSEIQTITAGINMGGFAVYLRDPDGFTLELVQAPASAAVLQAPSKSSVEVPTVAFQGC